MIQNYNPRALKRIAKDLQQVQDNPQEGINICQPFPDNLYHLLVNIKILTGPYKEVKLHMLMMISENYPIKAPKMKIFSGQMFTEGFHHHIFGEKFCIDILEDAIMGTSTQGSGWTPSYTFSTLLLQIQNFCSDPDMHSDAQLKECIKNLPTLLDAQFKYQYSHQIGEKTIVHSWKDPFPAFPKINSLEEDNNNNNNKQTEQTQQQEELSEQDQQQLQRKQRIQERLTCYLTQYNPIKDEKEIFGYPLLVTQDKFKRFQPVPITEMLSYEGYKDQMNVTNNKFQEKLQMYANQKSGNGQLFNMWVPVYINKAHFLNSIEIIDNQFFLLQLNYDPENILNIMPTILNKFIVSLLNGSVHQSIAAIEVYVQFVKFFKEYMKYYNNKTKDKIEKLLQKKVQDFMGKSHEKRNKNTLGDIGEFIQLLMVSTDQFWLNTEIMDKLLSEYAARQIFWIQKDRKEKQWKSKSQQEELDNAYKAVNVSNNLLIFTIEACKQFVNNKYLNTIEKDYCVVEEKLAESFAIKLKTLRQKISSYKDWYIYMGFKDIKIDQVYSRFQSAYDLSQQQGYTKNLQLQKLPIDPIIAKTKSQYEIYLEELAIEQRILKQKSQNQSQKDELSANSQSTEQILSSEVNSQSTEQQQQQQQEEEKVKEQIQSQEKNDNQAQIQPQQQQNQQETIKNQENNPSQTENNKNTKIDDIFNSLKKPHQIELKTQKILMGQVIALLETNLKLKNKEHYEIVKANDNIYLQPIKSKSSKLTLKQIYILLDTESNNYQQGEFQIQMVPM